MTKQPSILERATCTRVYPEGIGTRGVAYTIAWGPINDNRLIEVRCNGALRMELRPWAIQNPWHPTGYRRFVVVPYQKFSFEPSDVLSVITRQDVNQVRVCYVTPNNKGGWF